MTVDSKYLLQQTYKRKPFASSAEVSFKIPF